LIDARIKAYDHYKAQIGKYRRMAKLQGIVNKRKVIKDRKLLYCDDLADITKNPNIAIRK